MLSPDGWYGRVTESVWPPLLGRLDVRVEHESTVETDRRWLLSDALSEYLDIRRGDDGKLAATFKIGADRIAWWNDAGGLAGIVLMVASWAAAGVVGNAVYATLRSAARNVHRGPSPGPFAVLGPNEAEAMARWVACAEFHRAPNCRCPDTGAGRTVSTGVWDSASGDFVTIPPVGLVIALKEVEIRDGSWTVILSETEDGNVAPSREYEVAGVTGATFFVSARSRVVGLSRFDLG